MFGVKVKRIKTKNKYSVEEFFEAIKDQKFTAGEPQIVKHGFTKMICFPPLDSRNQVQILAAGKNKFQIQKGEEAGMFDAVCNMVIDDLTDGLSVLKGVAGNNAKMCEKLVDITTEELQALDL